MRLGRTTETTGNQTTIVEPDVTVTQEYQQIINLLEKVSTAI